MHHDDQHGKHTLSQCLLSLILVNLTGCLSELAIIIIIIIIRPSGFRNDNGPMLMPKDERHWHVEVIDSFGVLSNHHKRLARYCYGCMFMPGR
jgi:hypothetical protein